MPERVLVLGASARAAAASLRRAGFEPFTIDLFRDRDTALLADGLRCPPDDYPAGLFRLARTAPPGPWIYTGGLENEPELVGALAAERELWGNGPDVLRKVRDPLWLSETLNQWKSRDEHPWAFPRILPAGEVVPEAGRWLRKPLRGSGGHGVRFLTAGEAVPLDSFAQEFVEGASMSAVFAVGGDRTHLAGITRQLIGAEWLHPRSPFAWCGNFSAESPPPPSGGVFWKNAHRLGRVAGLNGLFGVDFVRTADGTACPVEINPRYPASVECLEHAGQQPLYGSPRSHPTDRPGTVGKGVYYAPFTVRVPASGPWDDSLRHAADVWRRPDFADIPPTGDRIEAGRPVCTLLAEADTPDRCEAELRRRAAEFDTFLADCREESPCRH